MKIKTKMTLFIGLAVIITVIIVISQTNRVIEKAEMNFMNIYANSRIKIIDNYFEQSSQELENRVFDNAYWDDLFYNLEEKNVEWIKENVTQFLYEQPNFYIDMVFLQNKEGTYIETYGDGISIEELKATNTYKKTLSEIEINKEYIRMNGKVYEIIAAPVTTNDKSEKNGVFILGREINAIYLKNLSRYFISDYVKDICIVKNGDGHSDVQYKDHLMEIYHPIKDVEGNEIAWIKAVYDTSIVDKEKHLILKEIILTISLYILIIGIIIILFSNKAINGIEKTIKQINLIAKGNYSNRLEEKGPNEIIKLLKSVNMLSEEIERRIKEQENNYLESIKALVTSLEVKDDYTKGHSERVAFYAFHLGKAVGYEELDVLVNAALVHDLGKIAVPEYILNKPGKLTDEEYEVIKKHPDLGYKILNTSNMFENIKYIIKYHHERYDGRGYPDGLYGENIPLGARILAVADVFDALTSDRSYRNAISLEEAMKIIIEGNGSHFDPSLVKAFEGIIYELYENIDFEVLNFT